MAQYASSPMQTPQGRREKQNKNEGALGLLGETTMHTHAASKPRSCFSCCWMPTESERQLDTSERCASYGSRLESDQVSRLRVVAAPDKFESMRFELGNSLHKF